MKFLNTFHKALLGFIALVNGVMLYLFLMHLPYGVTPLLLSLQHWDELSPQIQLAGLAALVMAIIGFLLPMRLSATWKDRLLYLRWQHPHPAHNAFLTTRRQPFESKQLWEAFPAVKDAAFDPEVQTRTWETLYQKHAEHRIVLNTRLHWYILRDLFVLSLMFLTAFLLGWAVNAGIPFAISSAYIFLFGAQFLFLMLLARRVGMKFVDNVLAVALGMKEDRPARKGRKQRRG